MGMKSVYYLKLQIKKNTLHVQAIIKTSDSQTGHSLIEALIALTVLLMISSLIPLLFIPIQKQPPTSQLEETSIFFSMLGKEIREGKSIEVNNNSLYVTLSNGTVLSFSRYHSLIRKQVNGLGHEVWVQNITEMVLEQHSDVLFAVRLIDTQGHEYHRFFRRIE